MTETQLPVSGADGNQTNTSSPQASAQGGSGLSGQKSSGVQPGTASSLLTTSSSSGVPLGNSALTTVNLADSGTTQSQLTDSTSSHHIHPALFGFSAILLVAAVALFWSASRGEKNTTI